MNGRYRRHSGHCSALARNGSVANDPVQALAVDLTTVQFAAPGSALGAKISMTVRQLQFIRAAGR